MGLINKISLAAKTTSSLLVDTILPPRCAGTGDLVDMPGMLSPRFWEQLDFIENPMCQCCGMPFSLPELAGMTCAACLETAPVFDQARAAVSYNDASRKLILSFKYGDRTQLIRAFTPWLVRSGHALIQKTDLVIPVPLHRRRLWGRRFNQSALLAKSLAETCGLSHLADGLIRTRATLQHKGLSRKERNDNVKGAFSLHPRHQDKINNRNILLVDDVFTSGATLNECARILKKHGAAHVMVLTLAKVTREEF